MKLTEALAVDPADEGARDALVRHLDGLRAEAGELGLEPLGSAIGESLRGLEESSFSWGAVLDVRILAGRFEELAARPEGSGTHRIPSLPPGAPQGPSLGSLVGEVETELRRGLLDSASAGPEAPLEPGRDAEVLTPLWKAIGEIRGVIERRSGGLVRFAEAPGIPLLTLSGFPSPEPPYAEIALGDRRILVADDDAEVRWLYVGMLREAGATVVEASDGIRALELARNDPPDLILADIVMPRLDGLGLCAAVRREPSLDGVPVVLLSWRDDLLHRMRELRAGARDYLRKELPARQILDRVDEALRPLAQLEASLTNESEVRGDVEDLGVAVLLRAVRRTRPDVRIALQDPWALFEVELRAGHMVQVTRMAINGETSEGEPALAELAGMRLGRFTVGQALEPHDAEGEPLASLDEAFDRSSRQLGSLLSVLADSPGGQVELDTRVLATYTRHSPPRIQRIVARLAEGTSPREIWESGEGSRALVDALLVTLARQGGVVAVVAADVPVPNEPAPSTSTPSMHETSSPLPTPPELAGTDPLDRENMRAQSAVAMHREPSNPMPRPAGAVWRFADPAPEAAEPAPETEFDWQGRVAPRVLGWAFAGALVATFGVLLYRVDVRERAVPIAEQTEPSAAAAAALDDSDVVDAPSPVDVGIDLPVDDVSRLREYAGELTEGTDPDLVVADSQGVLQLTGSDGVSVEVDGVFLGAQPLALVLEQGRHRVRYRVGDRWVDRFCYVRAGATRVLRAEFGPGGFVDAR